MPRSFQLLDLSEPKSPNRFVISKSVAITRSIISDLSSKLAIWRTICKKIVFRLFSFAIFDFKIRLNSMKILYRSPCESDRCAE